jgi:hypothetical protein
VHGDEHGQTVEMDLAPEVVRDFAGRADLAQGVVPPSGLEADAGDGKVVQAQEECANPALGQPKVLGVRPVCLGVAVQVEQAIRADEVRIELTVDDAAGPLERGRRLARQLQAWLKRPCQRHAPASACNP